MAVSRYSTGNRFVSIPDVLTSNCGVLDISFLSMRARAAFELHGTKDDPFLQPAITIDGQEIDLSAATWEQERHWIPSFTLAERGVSVKSRIFAPLAQRGFVWVIEVSSESQSPVELEVGWRGLWKNLYHVVGVTKPVEGTRHGAVSTQYGGVPFIEFRSGTPQFAVAFGTSEPMHISIRSEQEGSCVVTGSSECELAARNSEDLRYSFTVPISLAPGEQRTYALYVGLGLEETSAIASSADIEREGWENLYSDLSGWLESHKVSVHDERLDHLLNLNSFYNFFYSQGMTLDTEDLVLVTGRSSRCNASATYRDRDAMRWSLPAVLQINPGQARRMIEYVFTTQLRNVGIQGRFIDGIVMHPGFKLDELCAPVRALYTYVRATHDMSILFDRRVQTGVNRIRQLMSQSMHPSAMLFETVLEPSGEAAAHPYLTYDNVLAWRVLQDLSWMYELIHDLDRSEENELLAKQVHKAIMQSCIVNGPSGRMFAYSVDLDGNYELKDDPFGSLKLLAWYEFCTSDSPVYQNTLRWIHSEENPVSFEGAKFAAAGSDSERHPCILSVANDLLVGRIDEAVDFLKRATMDDDIACSSVDENTGEVLNGGAFAACAGYLAFALSTGLGATPVPPEPEPSLKLYEPPPPEIRDSIESTRL